MCSKLGVIQELQLYQFEGIISDEDLQLLEWVPTVSIYIPKNRVDATVLNASWALLKNVSLRFEEVPDNFEFLIGWKHLRNLSVLGPINTEEAEALISVIAQHMPRLKYLELSLLGVQNLPPKITQCKQLHGIRIVDGSDWARGLAVEEMGELVVPLRNGSKTIKIGKGVNAASLEKNVYMPLRWISSRPQLSIKETAYLKSLYPDVQEHEALTWLEDTEWEIDFAELEPLQPYPYEPMRSAGGFFAWIYRWKTPFSGSYRVGSGIYRRSGMVAIDTQKCLRIFRWEAVSRRLSCERELHRRPNASRCRRFEFALR